MAASFEMVLDASSRLSLTGALTVRQLADAIKKAESLGLQSKKITEIDLSNLQEIDTAGALLIKEWQSKAAIKYGSDSQRSTVEMVSELNTQAPQKQVALPYFSALMVSWGSWASDMSRESHNIISFMGRAVVLLLRALLNPKRLRLPEIARHIEHIGMNAMPIIGLISFLIAVVLAYQSVAQLRPYGGEQFMVDLIAISILREMGVLLTAIMVAGRSGSAFTAEIGVMKSREEVDALKVMGFDPFDMLVVPRLVAIIIALPLLTFFANMMGLLGGYLISMSLVDITLSLYLERVHYAIDAADLFVGMVKAPVFAFFIGIVGCMHGLRVKSSAESIGRETTTAVVKAIFLVLVLDAMFSIFFQKVGI